MVKLDQTIVNCIKKGLFLEVLTGEPNCYVYDSYYRGNHDVLLVVSTMIKWAREYNQVDFVKENFVAALSSIMRNNLIVGLDILNCYFIVSEDTKFDLQIDFEVFLKSVRMGGKKLGTLSDEDKAKFHSLMTAISKRTDIFDSIGYWRTAINK